MYTCMHCTLVPLVAMEVKSVDFLVTGKEAVDLRPVKGATMLAWAAVARVAMAVEDRIEEAIAAGGEGVTHSLPSAAKLVGYFYFVMLVITAMLLGLVYITIRCHMSPI